MTWFKFPRLTVSTLMCRIDFGCYRPGVPLAWPARLIPGHMRASGLGRASLANVGGVAATGVGPATNDSVTICTAGFKSRARRFGGSWERPVVSGGGLGAPDVLATL